MSLKIPENYEDFQRRPFDTDLQKTCETTVPMKKLESRHSYNPYVN